MKKLIAMMLAVCCLLVAMEIPTVGATNSEAYIPSEEDLESCAFFVELDNADAEARNRMNTAHQMAECARELGYDEDCETIQLAKQEWANAENIIKSNKTTRAYWKEKFNEYPVATIIWLYLKNRGYSDYCTAGILGNMMCEVGGGTLDIQYWLTSSSRAYFGMCQWGRHYPGVWGLDLMNQLDFLQDTIKYELDTFGSNYAKGYNYNSFLKMSTAYDAAMMFAYSYERCGSLCAKPRGRYAENAYYYFTH